MECASSILCNRSQNKWNESESWNTPSFLASFSKNGLLAATVEQFREDLNGKHVLYLPGSAKRARRGKEEGGCAQQWQQQCPYLRCIAEHPDWMRVDINFRKLVLVQSDVLGAVRAKMPLGQFKGLVDGFFEERKRRLVAPGDMVGVVAAQSISERFTQSTLNTFHLAGSHKSAAQQGIQRIVEIFEAHVDLNLPYLRPIDIPASKRHLILPQTLADSAETYGVAYLPNPARPTKFADWVVFFAFRSPGDIPVLDTILEEDTQNPNRVLILLPATNMSYSVALIWLQKYASVRVCGINNATEYDPEERTLYFARKTSLAQVFKTGRCMDDLAELTNFSLDTRCLVSNDISFLLEFVGIEATRAFLVKEIGEVLSREGIVVNARHVMLVVDYMCRTGTVRSAKFHGMQSHDGVILKATFQQATETFANAAARCAEDKLLDVSSQILVGKTPNIGTESVHLCNKAPHLLNKKFIIDHQQQIDYAPVLSNENVNAVTTASPLYIPASPVYETTVGEGSLSIGEFLEPNFEGF